MLNIQYSFDFVKHYGYKNLKDFFYESLPSRPYFSDAKDYLQILPKKQAATHSFIQHNPPWNLTWLVFDVDRSTSHYDWDDLRCPPPNFAIMNNANGHSHLLYGLEMPVHRQITANRDPLRYAQAIEGALTLKLNADRNYSNFISKNPLVDTWTTYEFQDYLYSLDLLSEYLNLRTYKKLQEELQFFGLGRNCTLFDITRDFAYSAVRDYFNASTPDAFIHNIYLFALKRNEELFKNPLFSQEILYLARSIGKWTLRNFSKSGLSQWGEARRQKSIAVRKEKSKERAREIIDIHINRPDLSNRAIAGILGLGEATVRRAIAEFNRSSSQSTLQFGL